MGLRLAPFGSILDQLGLGTVSGEGRGGEGVAGAMEGTGVVRRMKGGGGDGECGSMSWGGRDDGLDKW